MEEARSESQTANHDSRLQKPLLFEGGSSVARLLLAIAIANFCSSLSTSVTNYDSTVRSDS